MAAQTLYETLLEGTSVTYTPSQGSKSEVSFTLKWYSSGSMGTAFYLSMALSLPTLQGNALKQRIVARVAPEREPFLNEVLPLILQGVVNYYGALEAHCKAQGWPAGPWNESDAPSFINSHDPEFLRHLEDLSSLKAQVSFLLTRRPRGPRKLVDKALKPLQEAYLETYPAEKVSTELAAAAAWCPWANLLGPENVPLVMLLQYENALDTMGKKPLLPLAATLAQGRLLRELVWNTPNNPEDFPLQEELLKLLELWEQLPAGGGIPFEELPPVFLRRLLSLSPRSLRKWKLELPLRLKEYRAWVETLSLRETLFLAKGAPGASGPLAVAEARALLKKPAHLTHEEKVALTRALSALEEGGAHFPSKRSRLQSLFRDVTSNPFVVQAVQEYLKGAEESGTPREAQAEVLTTFVVFGFPTACYYPLLAGPPQAAPRLAVLTALADTVPLGEIPPLIAAVEKAATEVVTFKKWNAYFKNLEEYAGMPPAWWLPLVEA